MKKQLFLLLFLPLLAFTQVPQGVGYQGVATDANGIELVNQSISIRASVISASPTGTIEWQETHTTSTDTFGLFNLTIGQGTSTGNGAQTSFADITWGANTHFLKIEMDVNGGTNYSHMGTNQMMSVPYALYAENANINYDSISTLLSNDSTFINNFSFGSGGGCDFNYPEGLDGDLVDIHIPYNSGNTYTVPSGKRLYIIRINSNSRLSIDGVGIFNAYQNPNFSYSRLLYSTIIADENQIISAYNSDGVHCVGILIDATTHIQPLTVSSSSYTVPSSKMLVITHVTRGTGSFQLNGNGIIELLDDAIKAFPVASGSSITTNNGTFNGYLVDENYFDGCGGNGGSSSQTNSINGIIYTIDGF